MKLKFVEIKGFKAYKDATRVDFHPGANAIVGLNGSGKSSLLEAIALVVSEVYGKRAVDTKGLLHKGTRNSSLAAYVELGFDNTSRRLNLFDKDEVRMKRGFSLVEGKRDQFWIDNKKVTKQEFVNVLEAGAFSKTNPYYVVRQGKITELALMTDEGRLKLLKDFSGVQVYEEKRQSAEQTIKELEERTEEIDATLDDFTNKLHELEEQQEELKRYQELVTQRDLYRLVVREVELQVVLDDISATKQEIERLKKSLEELNVIPETQATNNEQLSTVQAQYEELALGKERISEDLEKAKNELSGMTRAASDRALAEELRLRKMEQLKKKTTALERELTVKRRKLLEEVEPKLQLLRKAKVEEEEKRKSLEDQNEAMRDKRHRCDKFANAAERRKYISKKEIPDIEARIREETQRLAEQSRLMTETQTKIESLQQRGDQGPEEIDRQKGILRQELDAKEKLIHDGRRRQQDLRRRLGEAKAVNVSRHMDKTLSSIEKAHRPNFWRGNQQALLWDADRQKSYNQVDSDRDVFKLVFNRVEALRQDEGRRLPPVIGPVWAILQVDPKWRKAVTAALGNALENLVCADDQVGSDISKMLKERAKRGNSRAAVNVTPFEQMAKRYENFQQKYPAGVRAPRDREAIDLEKLEAIPLGSVVNCPPCLEALVNQLCGKFLLVKSQDVGRRLSKLSDFDCVTPDGDKLTRRGAVQGGFRDTSSDLLSLAAVLGEEIRSEYVAASEALEVEKELQQETDKERRVTGEANDIKSALNQLLDQARFARDDGRRRMIELKRLEDLLIEKKEVTHKLTSKIETDKQKVLELRKILLSQEDERVTQSDLQLMEKLDTQLEKHRVALDNLVQQEADYQSSRQALFIDLQNLSDNLNKKMDDLAVLEETEISEASRRLDDEMSGLRSQVETLEGQLKKTNKDWIEAQRTLAELEQSEKAREEEEAKRRKHIIQITQNLERKMAHQKDLEQRARAHQSEKEILLSTAGLASGAVDDLKSKDLMSLKRKMAHFETLVAQAPKVNQKALDDLIFFQEEHAETMKKRTALEESLHKVKDLMIALDERRSQTLRRAFDHVNENLAELFASIVPGGKAKLVIKKLSEDKINELRRARQSILACRTPGNNPPTSSSQSVTSQSNSSQTSVPPSSTQPWRLEVAEARQVALPAEPHWDEVASGIEIKASFHRGAVEDAKRDYFPIMALSGGQKTVLALSLIFAMQRCDQAPFYILDEADAALDETYRSAVARLIQDSTSTSQFLLTTFRRELCEICDKHFQVTNEARVALVKEIDKAAALEVILENAREMSVLVANEDI